MIRWLAQNRYNFVDLVAVSVFTSFVKDGHFWWGLATFFVLAGLSYTLEQAAARGK